MLNDFNELFTTETYSLLDLNLESNIFNSYNDPPSNSISFEINDFELDIIEPYDVFGVSLRKNNVRQKFTDITENLSKKENEESNWANLSFATFDRTEAGCCLQQNQFHAENKVSTLEQSFISKIDVEPLSKRNNIDNCILMDLNVNKQTVYPKPNECDNKNLKRVKKRPKSKSQNKKELHKCKCTKSKCLRLYCECFAKGLICGVDCDCKDCHNNEEHKEFRDLVVEETLEKNPKAFTSKYKKFEQKDGILHSRGCNCSKTGCIKEYCECYKAGTGCSALCKCTNCQNHKIDLAEEEIQIYYDKVLRKRRKRSVLTQCFEFKTNSLKNNSKAIA